MAGPPSRPNKIIIAVEMTDLDILERVAAIVGVKVSHLKARNSKWKLTYKVTISNRRAANLMLLLYPHMGKRRQEQIQTALEKYTPNRTHLSDNERQAIRELRAAGKTMREIAETVGRSKASVERVCANPV